MNNVNAQNYCDDPPDIEAWFDKGIEQGATHMFVVCENVNISPVYTIPPNDISPVYVIPPTDFHRIEQLCCIAGHIMNLYDLSRPFKEQKGNYE